MAQFELHADQFKPMNAGVAFIAAEKRKGMFKPERFLEQHPQAFPFLLDEDRGVTKQYGVYHALAKDAFRIARPATFVIDRKGIICWIYVGSSQTDRARLADIVEAARAAAQP